jgi:hypothetical protein
MKLATTILAAFLALSPAYSTSISWGEDSGNGFNLNLAGAGVPYSETFYQVLTGDRITPTQIYPQGTRNIFQELLTSPSGSWQVLAQFQVLDSFGAGLADFWSASISSLAIWSGGQKFNPVDELKFTSQPDLRDPETWSWVLNVSARRPVPEQGNSAWYLAFALGLMLCFRPKFA